MHYTKIQDRFARVILLTSVFLVIFGVWHTPSAHAATLFMSSSKDVANIGDTIEVLIKTDSEGVGINATQATLQYPKDILTATKIDKAESVFNFWLEEPKFSNDTGQVTFVGGSSAGQSGKSLQILKIIFSVKGAGRAQLTFTDGAITASDGSGTNVLSNMQGLVINSVSKTGLTEQNPTAPLPTQIPKPIQIARPAAPAQGLPIKPILTIPLYPAPDQWHASVGNFLVQWSLPADVSDVSTSLDQNINYGGVTSEGLFDSKVFPIITKDGVWYLHVRFKNSIGWGPSANYRIALDTHPPLEFTVSVSEGNPTDVPAPKLQFITKDSMSDVKEYQIQVGGADIIKIPSNGFNGSYQLPLQAPGKKSVIIKALDEADNAIEENITLEITPIASPAITFVTRELFSDESNGLAVKGTSMPKTNVLLRVHQQSSLVAEGTARAGDNGNWEFTFDQVLKNGSYQVAAQAQDARGALSLVVESDSIKVKARPIIQIGAFQLGAGGAALFLLFILIASFGGGMWFYRKKQEKLSLRVGFAESEITKMFQLLKEDVDKLSKAVQTSTTSDDEYALKRLQENLAKMESYIKKGVQKIKN